MDAASETMATSFRPAINASVSRTFRLSSSDESGFARSLYTGLRGGEHITATSMYASPKHTAVAIIVATK